MNWLEKILIKKLAKKVIKKFPKFKEKGVDFVEEKAEKLFEKIEMAIFQFVEES
jgi:histone H3/H4